MDPVEKNPDKALELIKYAWLLIPIVPYINMVNQYSLNFPFLDDYNAILEFLCNYRKAAFFGKISLLFSQHAEHRIFLSRVIYVLYNDLFGKINFRSLIFLGNAELIVSYLLLIYFIRKAVPRYWSIVALVMGFCLFDVSSYENANFAMCGICNYGALMLFLASLFFYTRASKSAVIAAAVIEAVAIFSSGNGMVGAFLIVVFLLLSKEKLKAMISGAIVVVCVPLYFLNFTKEAPSADTILGFHIDRIVPFFLHLAGGHFCYNYQYDNGITIGVIFLVVLLLVIPVSRKLTLLPGTLSLLTVLAFALASMATAATFRSNNPDLQHISHSSRYLMYAHLCTGIAFTFMFLKLKQPKVKWAVCALAAALLLYNYTGNYHFGEMGFARQNVRQQETEYYYGQRNKTAHDIADRIAKESCQLEIYCIQDER